MTNDPNPVYLYVLGRTDMRSLTAVKAGVQLGHACNQMVYTYDAPDERREDILEIWQKETGQGFGTTIHLAGGTIEQVRAAVLHAKEYDLYAAMVRDPTYPIRDGDVIHQINIETCGFIFGRKKDCEAVTGAFELMPSPEDADKVAPPK